MDRSLNKECNKSILIIELPKDIKILDKEYSKYLFDIFGKENLIYI